VAIVLGLRWTVIPLISFAGYILINLVFAFFPERA
jgi:hypothetical protein